MVTNNVCVGCGGAIRAHYNPGPSDKPSAKIICDKCGGVAMYVQKVIERRLDEVLRSEDRTRESIKHLTEELKKEQERLAELLKEEDELENAQEEMA